MTNLLSTLLLLAGLIYCGASPAKEFEIRKRTRASEANRVNFGVGIETTIPVSKGNSTSFAPLGEFQYALSQFLALGLGGSYVYYNNGATTGYSLMASANYYENGVYGGFWFQAAGGIYQIGGSTTNGVTTASTSSPTVRGGIGWRWHPEEYAANSGILIGPQATLATGNTSIGILARIDFAIDFVLADIFY